MALADAVALVHAAAVVLLLTGALLALAWRRVLLVSAPVTAAVTAVHIAGADCPLTTWERHLRARGGDAYDDGFLEHYAYGPLGLDAADAAVQVGTYAVVLAPNLLGYGLLAARARRGRARAVDPRRAPDPSSPDPPRGARAERQRAPVPAGDH